MRTKKIRGHTRIWKDIEKWKKANLKLNLENLKQYERDYVKIWVHPYSGISLTNSRNPEPKGETKKRILNGLFEIYENWKRQIEELNEPYYLKIWFFESRLSKSQVVCAVGDSIVSYQNTFNIPNNEKEFKQELIGVIINRTEKFKWINGLDEKIMFSSDIGNPEDYENQKMYLEDKKRFNNKLKKKHTRKTLKDGTVSYVFEIGNVWIGGK